MSDPLASLAILGPAALTEGVRFLYDQAGELLKRRRDRREVGKASAASQPGEVAAASARDLEGALAPLVVDANALEQVEQCIREFRDALQGYVEGHKRIHSGDVRLLEMADALRQCLEAIYQQRITFPREQRPPSGPVVEGWIDVDTVAGYAAAVRARTISDGHLSAQAHAEHVGPGGVMVGVEADRIGGNQ